MRVVLLLGLLFAVSPARASVVDASADERALWPHLELLEDPPATLSLEDVQGPAAARFQRFSGRFAPNFGFTASAVWVRVTLRNGTGTSLVRWLEVAQSTLDEVRLFVPGGAVRVQGRTQPLDSQELRRPTYAFRLDLPPGDTTLHLRFASENELQLPLTLWEPGALAAHDLRSGFAHALAYGFLLAMALYNLFIWLFTRDAAHGYYTAYVLLLGTWLSLVDGTLPMLLPRSIGVFPRWPFLVFGSGGFIASASFARHVLQLRQARPRMDRLVAAYQLFLVAFTLATLTLLTWRQQNVLTTSLVVVNLGLLLSAGVLRIRDGFAPARYYVAAFVALFGFFLAGGLATQGLLPFPGPGLFLHVGVLLEALILSIALAEGTRRRNQQIERLHAAGRRFVPFEFLALLKRPALPDVRVGDQVEREMTVSFADIRGFTQLVERLSPAETIALVNDYLQAMEPPIRAQGGFVDKYIGDAVMALFESPAAATRAALGCLAAVEAMNEKRPETSRIRIGIGLHTGPLVLGTVGSPERLSCTVIGDSVNLASRVESLTKRYATPVLLTGATSAGLDDTFSLRPVDRVAVKGKREPVLLFELLDALPSDVRQRRQEAAPALLAAREGLAKGAIDEAVTSLGALVERHPDDVPARLQWELARRLVKDGHASWDGVTRLDEK